VGGDLCCQKISSDKAGRPLKAHQPGAITQSHRTLAVVTRIRQQLFAKEVTAYALEI
jgi:hypothetical protein